MSDIKNRINSLKDAGYFREMQVTTVDDEQVIYVVVEFPERWMIDDEIQNLYNVTYQRGNKRGEYYFCADMETGFDKVFDAIDYNVNKMLDAQERANLLTIKIKELTKLFEDETISVEALRTLEFSFSKKFKRNKASTKQDEEVIENNEENASEA